MFLKRATTLNSFQKAYKQVKPKVFFSYEWLSVKIECEIIIPKHVHTTGNNIRETGWIQHSLH